MINSVLACCMNISDSSRFFPILPDSRDRQRQAGTGSYKREPFKFSGCMKFIIIPVCRIIADIGFYPQIGLIV
ncbi:MAG: hypothetical protein JW842_13475, partial [Prolixibacteraceae bacterium]|nr:hypothetical protein [Prolixibacteraceae bacterium]